MTMPALKRPPVSYFEYPSDMLASRKFKVLSMEERGLLYTMRMEMWVNNSLPKNHKHLAKLLGETEDVIAKNLLAIMPFFEIIGDEIISPDLEIYRMSLYAKRDAQSAAAKKTNALLEAKKYPVDGVIKLNLRK